MSEEQRMEWLRLYSEGNATAEITEALESEIQQDEKFRSVVVEYLQLDAALAGAIGSLPEAKVVSFPRKKAILGAIAAALALVAALVWQIQPGDSSGLMVDVLEADCQPALNLGPQKFSGEIRIDAGLLRFKMGSGAIVDVAGPASFSVENETQLNLHRGNLTADAGGDTIGFVVETTSAHIVDLGTRFGVSVDAEGQTDVVVIEGKVEVFKDKTAAKEKRLLASLVEGEAVQVKKGKKARRLKTVSLKRDSLVPTGKHRSKLIGDVTDNLDREGFNRFYAIEPGAMGSGARLHTDRPGIRWESMEGKKFPSMLEGADIVRTFFNDRRELDHEIRLELKERSVLFIINEANRPVPEWLSGSFKKSHITLRSGKWKRANEDSDPYRYYDVWKGVFPPGTVVLGPCRDSSQRQKAAMYGIVIKDARP